MGVSSGIGKTKFVWSVPKGGPSTLRNNASLSLMNARITMMKGNAQIAIVGMTLVRESASYHQQIAWSREILDAKYGIGNQWPVFNVLSVGILERMGNACRWMNIARNSMNTADALSAIRVMPWRMRNVLKLRMIIVRKDKNSNAYCAMRDTGCWWGSVYHQIPCARQAMKWGIVCLVLAHMSCIIIFVFLWWSWWIWPGTTRSAVRRNSNN